MLSESDGAHHDLTGRLQVQMSRGREARDSNPRPGGHQIMTRDSEAGWPRTRTASLPVCDFRPGPPSRSRVTCVRSLGGQVWTLTAAATRASCPYWHHDVPASESESSHRHAVAPIASLSDSDAAWTPSHSDSDAGGDRDSVTPRVTRDQHI
jgi:hypothetical protein